MVDGGSNSGNSSSSNQFTKWLYTPELLEQCRERANREARQALSKSPPDDEPSIKPIVCTFASNPETIMIEQNDNDGPLQSHKGAPLLNPREEAALVDFYASKLPSLIGPLAQVPRLRRDIKVAATAATLYRRFFLSNSVMMHDPKAMMVAAAFLGAKVEDAMADVRYLEEGTKLMNAAVSTPEILSCELSLLTGVDFDLQCVHPYKAVLAYTEDLRTFLKSDKGRTLASFAGNESENRKVVGQDLKPVHDAARRIVDDVIVSDVPLLSSAGKVGLAALEVANEELLKENKDVPKIDFGGYLKQRFDKMTECVTLEKDLVVLCGMLKGLREGKHGCGNHNTDLVKLKAINKKLKKCRVWGGKKDKKRKKDQSGEQEQPQAKRVKTEAS